MISSRLAHDIKNLAVMKGKIDSDMERIIRDYNRWSDGMDKLFRDLMKEVGDERCNSVSS